MSTGDLDHAADWALANTDDWWASCAWAALAAAAATRRPFDAYALTELGVPDPDHPARWGGLFAAASAAGLIQVAGYGPSRRPGVHGSLVRLWVGTDQPQTGDNAA